MHRVVVGLVAAPKMHVRRRKFENQKDAPLNQTKTACTERRYGLLPLLLWRRRRVDHPDLDRLYDPCRESCTAAEVLYHRQGIDCLRRDVRGITGGKPMLSVVAPLHTVQHISYLHLEIQYAR